MVALPVASRGQVEQAHALAIRLGAVDEGAPGLRGDLASSLYACHFRDPVGNKLCICHFEQSLPSQEQA